MIGEAQKIGIPFTYITINAFVLFCQLPRPEGRGLEG
ncbi:hypothetical protein J2T58_000311 [Methanocalculus alkaliphilus]|nr:hypothetical protein [Methanocalculus alkaliphilus]